jgi:hypothetical protein
VDLDHGEVLEQAIRTRTAGWDMEKLPGTKKFLEKLSQAKASDKRDLYRSYFESREGAVVACSVLYTNLKDQMVSLYQSDYPDYLKNPLKHNLSPQWSKIKHSLYRDSAKILLNKHLKSHLLKIDETEKWNITAPYAQDLSAKKETSFSLKALFREPPDTNPLSNGSYHEWMQEVAKKYLEKKGYTLVETIPPNLNATQKEKHITNDELKTFLQLGNGAGMQSIYNHRLKKIFGIQWTEIPASILKRGVFFEDLWRGWNP